jgi:predicted ATPase
MLKSLSVKGFKSLTDIKVDFPRLTVLFGPNAAGKSNLLEAVQMLSRLGTSRTLAEAFADPVRGYPLEAFQFSAGGLPELLRKPEAQFTLDATLDCSGDPYLYRIGVRIQPGSGALTVRDEYLAKLGKAGHPKGKAAIEHVDGQLHVRRKSKPAHPRQEPVGLSHSLVSDPRWSGVEYAGIERCRNEFEGWRIYYLDPRVAMRAARPPADVQDIGILGENIASFLYRLKAEHPKHFAAVNRTFRSLIPSVEGLNVDLDEKRGTLDIQVRQDGADFSSRIISEGTLRVLALCAIAVNPWAKGLIAFEEPENGVHPRRLELIAELLFSLALQPKRQVIVTTHSALFCDVILKKLRGNAAQVAMLNVRRRPEGTEVIPFRQSAESLFKDAELTQALTAPTEDGLFEALLLRGLLDE